MVRRAASYADSKVGGDSGMTMPVELSFPARLPFLSIMPIVVREETSVTMCALQNFVASQLLMGQ